MNDMKFTVRAYYYWVYSGVAKIGVTIDEAELGIRRQILPMHYVDGHGVPTSLDPVLTVEQYDNWSCPRTKNNFKFPSNNNNNLIAFGFNRVYADLPCDLYMVGMTIYGDKNRPSDLGFIQLDKNVESKKTVQGVPVTLTQSMEDFFRSTITPLNSGNNYGTTELVSTQSFLYLDTNIPFFDTVEHAKAYINSGGNTLTGLLNGDEVLPEDTNHEYFIKNTVYKNGSLYRYSDYKFKTTSTGGGHKLYLLASNDTIGYDLVLHGQHDSTITEILSRNRNDPANAYAQTSSANTEYLKRNQSTVGGDTYKSSFFSTNIYIFGNQADADNYVNSGDTSGAINKEAVNRANGTLVDGHIGDVVSQTDNGSCKMTMVSGSKIYAVTSLALSAFFNNVLFNNDAVTQGKTVMEQVLDGTQMFGANQINAIGGCLYLPLDIDDIATTSDVTHATIGSYIADLNGKQVLKNNKMINCGTVFFEAPYGDWRDYECKLFCILPFCGIHELNISAYINSNVTLKYAVDVTSGACTAYLYSDNKIVDAFDGSMGVSRPLTAVNQQAQADAVVNGIISTATSTAKTIGTAGTAMVGGSALSSATTGAKAISAGGEIANAGSNFGGSVQGTILQAYNTLQSAIDQPMTNRGGFAGILGQFGNMSPYFVFAWQKNSKPANELETVGLPSNAGGAVGGFGGFLQCSAFNLANGFTGTDNEANEIYSIMSSGVYVS